MSGAISPLGDEFQPQLPTDDDSQTALSAIVRSTLRTIGFFAICATLCFAIDVALSLVSRLDLLALPIVSKWERIVVKTICLLLAIVQIAKIRRGIRDLRAAGASFDGKYDPQTTYGYCARPVQTLRRSICSAQDSFALFATIAAVCFAVSIALALYSSLLFNSSGRDPNQTALYVVASWGSIFAVGVFVALMFAQISSISARIGDLRALESDARGENRDSTFLSRVPLYLILRFGQFRRPRISIPRCGLDWSVCVLRFSRLDDRPYRQDFQRDAQTSRPGDRVALLRSFNDRPENRKDG